MFWNFAPILSELSVDMDCVDCVDCAGLLSYVLPILTAAGDGDGDGDGDDCFNNTSRVACEF